jgi:alpha-L-rhamnosidase
MIHISYMKRILLFAASLLLIAACCDDPSSGGRLVPALDDSVWDCSMWISASDAPVKTGSVSKDWRAAEGASWFVSQVRNEGKVVSAVWMTSGLGVYDIYVNGRLVGEEVLKPGFTHWEKTKFSYTYDITDMFDKASGAENMLSAQVNPGWWADKIVTPAGYDGFVGKKCAFRGVLQLTFADGSVKCYGTDLENWKAGVAGPVRRAAIFDGELYDAREKDGHCCPDRLSAPEENTEFKGGIYPSEGAEVYHRHDLAMAPVRAYVWNGAEGADDDAYGKVVITKEFSAGEDIVLVPGETLVVDFGQNAAAVPYLEFKAKEGTVLTCLPSEILNDGNGARSRGMDGPEGSTHRTNLRLDGGMVLEYTFGPERGYVSYIPRFSFFGYRYISMTTTSKVRIRTLRSVPVTSVKAEMETGRIVTGNELINRLISNTRWSMLSNYLSVPTDCPQRDERLGWSADTQVFAETGSFFADVNAFMRKWMRDMRDTQADNGAFSAVAPVAQYGIEKMHCGWSDAGVIVPWVVWKQYGDVSVIDENWEAMERYMALVDSTRYEFKLNKKDNRNFQFADWLSYEALESNSGRCNMINEKGKSVKRPETHPYWNYLGGSYWAMDAAMMRDMAAATGRDVRKYEDMTGRAKAYLKEEFLEEDGSFRYEVFNTMQTPALFALKNSLVEGKAKEDMISRLRENFKEHDGCLQTGFLGTSILMTTLTANGMSDIAYDLLFQRKNPSWLYSIDNGATTIWERWNSYTLESGMGQKGMNSFNHYAYGCVCEWLWETAAGIASDPSDPGFRHMIMSPVPDRRLGSLEAEYRCATGLIKSAWRYEGEKWIWDFTIPEGSHATVTLPGETQSKVYESGTYTIEI